MSTNPKSPVPSKSESHNSELKNAPSDPPILTWVDTIVPPSVQPYARLARMDKPIGTWLLLWPCYWSLALSPLDSVYPNTDLLLLFGIGAFVMRGAGCTINDAWDAKLDAQVTRTATRPLAMGSLTTNQAATFLVGQLLVGLGVLVNLPHPYVCIPLGAASLPLVAFYPYMKRIMPYPQLVLGLTFNWGAWMGYAAVHGAVDLPMLLPLYISGVAWTMVYDTLYAHQDKVDDQKLGLHSTALTFGSNTKPILHGFAALSYASWLAAGYQSDIINAFYALGITGAYGHLLWQIQTANLEDPHNLAKRFRSNHTVGAVVFGSIVAGNVM